MPKIEKKRGPKRIYVAVRIDGALIAPVPIEKSRVPDFVGWHVETYVRVDPPKKPRKR